MKDLSKNEVSHRRVGEEGAGQRVDNYLLKVLKGVPKSHIYRILRSGEVRVNSRRVRPEHRLEVGDDMRVPPVRVASTTLRKAPPASETLERAILHEDDHIIVLDKPAGLAVHGGSGLAFGVIEQLRGQRPEQRFLELAHRLDRDTSGVLLIAKKRSALTALHEQLREGRVRKLYLALVVGRWSNKKQSVRASLHKHVLASGERRVSVHDDGQQAHTIVELVQAWPTYSLVRAELKTGRTHQIRVHLAHVGYPIAGDDKYGTFEANRELAKRGFKRMFLHAASVTLSHPAGGAPRTFEAPLPASLREFIATL